MTIGFLAPALRNSVAPTPRKARCRSAPGLRSRCLAGPVDPDVLFRLVFRVAEFLGMGFDEPLQDRSPDKPADAHLWDVEPVGDTLLRQHERRAGGHAQVEGQRHDLREWLAVLFPEVREFRGLVD